MNTRLPALADRQHRVEHVAPVRLGHQHDHRHEVQEQRQRAQQPEHRRQAGEAAGHRLHQHLRPSAKASRTVGRDSTLSSSSWIRWCCARISSSITQRADRCSVSPSCHLDAASVGLYRDQHLADRCKQRRLGAAHEFDLALCVRSPAGVDAGQARHRARDEKQAQAADQGGQYQQTKPPAHPARHRSAAERDALAEARFDDGVGRAEGALRSCAVPPWAASHAADEPSCHRRSAGVRPALACWPARRPRRGWTR